MAKAYVIRHAEVVVDPNLPSYQWDLSPEAETSIRRISRREKPPFYSILIQINNR